ncbi:enoyl-CoA hydratase-related protein [Pseudaquabacterium pictum]|uniref:Enoyl-CoA hydratase n=1 Tax=Pseudaquabacterium pictum TaxID=2315236 RepID=A0A480AWF6_9BURK|nr:enoyl-CoA hydratase-related protein [Rubrivivax pictus]GCL63128.1 enoyl-CoA hydratase [Rubrivivax pictus]
MTTWTCFDVTMDGAVAHVRMNQPQRHNAMTPAFWAEIPQLFRQLDAAGGVRAAVLSSVGKHFSAGMDLSVFANAGTLGTVDVAARERFRHQLRQLQGSFHAIAEARFPVIAAIQGGCIGGAVDLATACCLRYCSREAWFCIQEINIGMMADVGTMNRMPKQIPEAVMRELAYTGDRLGAERAERLGFVNGLFDDAAATVAGALAVAQKIAARAPVAVAASKEMINYTRDHSVAESFTYMNALQPGVFDPEDIARAVAAQKAGQPAAFADLPAIAPPLG